VALISQSIVAVALATHTKFVLANGPIQTIYKFNAELFSYVSIRMTGGV